MRARANAIVAPLLIAAFVAFAGCGGGTRACKDGTLFVTVTFAGSAAPADQVTVEVRIDGVMTMNETAIRNRTGGGDGTFEISFPHGYPTGKKVDVLVTAFANASQVGSNTGSVMSLPPGCTALTIALGGGSAGTGGMSGTGGSSGGAAGTGGSTAGHGGMGGSTAGRGGSGGSTGERGGTGGGGRGGVDGRGGAGGTGPVTCVMGLSTVPGTALITDFTDATVDGNGDVRYGSLSAAHGGTFRYASTTEGTLTVSGGALTFTATVEAPNAAALYPYSGFGLFFDGPACVNASAYQGVQFTLSNVTNVTGPCQILFKFTDSAHSSSSDDPMRGTCSSAAGSCFGGAFPVTAGTVQMPFTAVPNFAGNPATLIDPAKLIDLQFQMQPSGTTACSGSFTIDDIRFYGSAGGSGGGGRGGTTGAAGTSGGGGTGGGTGGASSRGGTTGTGGTSGGGGTGTGGGGGTPNSCGTGWAVNAAGFVTMPAVNSCWHGYSYTTSDSGSSFTPRDFSACGNNCVLSITGTVGPATTANSFAGFAMLGFNIAQDFAGTTAPAVVPAGTGLVVPFVASTGGLPLRVQVGDGSTIWCYVVTGASPATIPWSMFKTTCWDPLGGTAYAKQPISNITMLVPGGAVETPNVSLSFANLSEY